MAAAARKIKNFHFRTTHRSIALWALFFTLVCLCPPQDFDENLALVVGPQFFQTSRQWQGMSLTVPWPSQTLLPGLLAPFGLGGVAFLRALCCLGFILPLWTTFHKSGDKLQGALCWLLGSCFPFLFLGRFFPEALCGVTGALLMAALCTNTHHRKRWGFWLPGLAWGLHLTQGGWALVWPALSAFWILRGKKGTLGQRYGFGVLAFLTGLIFYGTIRLWETRGSPTPFWDWQRYDWFSYLASWHDGPVVLNPQVPLFWFCVAIPLGGGFLALGQGHWKTLGPYGVWVGLQCWGALGSAQPFFHMLPAVAPLAFLCGHCTRGPHPSPWALANLLLGAVGALGLLCLPWAVSLGVAMPEPLLLLAAGFWKVPNPIPTWLVFASLCLVSAGYVAWSRGRVQLLYHCQLGLAAVVFGVLALAQYQHHWGVARVLDTLCPKGPLVTVGLLAPVWDWQGQQKGCSVVQRPRGALGSPPTTFAAVVPWWDGLNCPSLGFSSRIPLDPYVVCGGGQNPPPGGKTH